MEGKGYIDMDGMQKRVDAAHKEHLDKEWDKVAKKTAGVVIKNQEVRALLGKSLQREIDEEEKKIVTEMEAEKNNAIKEIEEKYRRRSTKLQLARQEDEDADLRAMLRNINSRS